MNSMMGIINLMEDDSYLSELTLHRPLAAVPFGGKYRMIDFILSNMVHSGIHNVGILAHQKYRSLMDHVRSGEDWDLARKQDGLFLLPPAYANHPWRPYRGDAENFHSNLDYIEKSRQNYVVIAGVHVIYKADYRDILEFHQEVQADVTLLYSQEDCTVQDCSKATTLRLDERGMVRDMLVNPGRVKDQKLSLDTYIMERELLIDLVNTCIAHGDFDFAKHCLIKNLSRLKIAAYPVSGYVARINCLQSFFKHNFELLQPEIWRELFHESAIIFTKTRDEPATKYANSAAVRNSLVAGGCLVEGRVENSILFCGVTVQRGACIKDSIIMQDCDIAGNTILENVICDKNVRVTSGKQLRGEFHYPLVIKKGIVI
ncbi:glucose-1-phosphate adenylyltransferase subunit GlgD [Acetonema longum]|uniref:Glucose-1-phosphate adenylyltransferase, GlgD subunit n=1 Tax=Acetonema longum DSM 6540 TaxID=1009370 RepID=F7NDK5_9FIRM|nr:glucose-1-phosphate adenylyltransferase subunit GlgD [Acetonema longum]EGO65867.1 glucose-1-phosphate adenylyltransferase, GlgD subunit [Acetonema longum DSM 6540]